MAAITLKSVKSATRSLALAYPRRAECNLCHWQGRRLANDRWHKAAKCPRCGSGVRQRLFIAALQHVPRLGWADLIDGKRLLHFAPEPILQRLLAPRAGRYQSADYLRQDCDLQLDMTDMPAVASDSVDVAIAFDVLEHVPDYGRALRELHRVVVPGGWVILTVPQQDGLELTREDPSVNTPEARAAQYGQWDHLRMFGNDFPEHVARHGFQVTAVSEKSFDLETARRHILAPPVKSAHPLATNYRKVYFCHRD